MGYESDLISQIKLRIDIPELLRAEGFTPVRVGSQYWSLAEHDSFRYNEATGAIYWNSVDFKGNVIQLYQYLHSCSFDDALRDLRRMMHSPAEQHLWHTPRKAEQAAPAERGELHIPPPIVANNKRVWAYLTVTRGIEPEVVRWLMHNKLLWADDRCNLVYAARDANGKPYYAAKKSCLPGSSFRQVIKGSDCSKRFGVNLYPAGDKPLPKMLVVTEAAVDMWSAMSLMHMAGKDFTQYAYLSLECCHEAPLLRHLAEHPNIKSVLLCQDNDDAGNRSRAACREAIANKGLKVRCIDRPPVGGKDINEDLQLLRTAEQNRKNTIERGLNYEIT